jgi:hypothetical protein
VIKICIEFFSVRAQGVFSVECKTVKIYISDKISELVYICYVTYCNEEYEQIDEQCT